MAPYRLIKIFVLILILAPTLASATEFKECKLVKLEGKTVKGSQTTELCFLGDDTYFISKNCSSLECKFIDRLKQKGTVHSEDERPGLATCRALNGVPEEVSLPGVKMKIMRCLFTDEGVSISLNMLESWNGKHFSGPSRPLDL